VERRKRKGKKEAIQITKKGKWEIQEISEMKESKSHRSEGSKYNETERKDERTNQLKKGTKKQGILDVGLDTHNVYKMDNNFVYC